MGYSKKTPYYSERIALNDPAHMISMTDLVTIEVETLMMYSVYPLEKDFTELIRMKP